MRWRDCAGYRRVPTGAPDPHKSDYSYRHRLGVVVAGIAGVTFVTTVAIPAVTAFGAALNTALGPIGWVALAITGIVAAGTALVALMSDAEDETADMTATTRQQYYELQDLNAEYDEACEKYGETSEEARAAEISGRRPFGSF